MLRQARLPAAACCRALHSCAQVEATIKPNLFKRPQALLSLHIAGVAPGAHRLCVFRSVAGSLGWRLSKYCRACVTCLWGGWCSSKPWSASTASETVVLSERRRGSIAQRLRQSSSAQTMRRRSPASPAAGGRARRASRARRSWCALCRLLPAALAPSSAPWSASRSTTPRCRPAAMPAWSSCCRCRAPPRFQLYISGLLRRVPNAKRATGLWGLESATAIPPCQVSALRRLPRGGSWEGSLGPLPQ